MARISPIREEFDRDRDFVVFKPMRINGISLVPGQPFDKSQATDRRLRQLWDTHYVIMGPADVGYRPSKRRAFGRPEVFPLVPALEAPTGGPDVPKNLEALTDAELKDFLKRKGVIPRPRSTREQLLTKAAKVVTATLWAA